MRVWLLAIGAVSLLGQVVLLRELAVAFFGSELVLVLALGIWLLGCALGASLGRRGHVPHEQDVRWVLAALGVTLPLGIGLARGVRRLCGGVQGGYLPFTSQMLGLCACLLPVSICLGLAFQWAAKRYVGGRRTLAGAYALESLGAAIGGLASTLLLVCGVQNSTTAFLGALIACGAAMFPRRREFDAARLATAATIACLVFAFTARGAIDRRTTEWNHPQLLAMRDTPYGRVTLTQAAAQVAVFENDALAYESQGTAAEEFVQLAALQRDSLRTVLVLGGAAQGLVGQVLQLRPLRVDDVELDGACFRLVTAHLPGPERANLADTRVHIFFDDPRRFLERTVTYDLIVSGLPEPESGRTNRCYTREFFAACAARLVPGGVLALRLQGSENLWTPQRALRASSVVAALRTAFAHVVVLPGGTNFFLASAAPLDHDPAVLAARLQLRALETRLVTPAYLRYLYTNDRYAETAALLERTPVEANTDLRPACYQSTMLLWLARFFPRSARLRLHELDLGTLWKSGWSLLGAGIVASFFLVARRRPTPRRALFAGTAGFAGMLYEAALLLAYQTRSGVLYQDLGLLLTAFMAGLAVGAGGLEIWGRAKAGRAPRQRASGAIALAALVVLGFGSAAALRAGLTPGLAGTSALLLACGAAVAVVFSTAAAAQSATGVRAMVSPVYAADLIGGALASVAAGLVLIPIVGLPGTAAIAGTIAIAAALLL